MTLLTYHSKYVVQSAVAVSTTSTNLVDDTQASQTFTLDSTKTVLILYQSDSNSNNGNGDFVVNAINVDGTDFSRVADSPSFGYAVRNFCFWVGTLNSGSHTIKGRFCAENGYGSVNVENRTLIIYILNGNEFSYVDNSTVQSTSSRSYVDDSYATATFTPSGNSTALIIYGAANKTSDTEAYQGKKICIRVGTTDYTACEAQQSSFDDGYPDSVATFYILGLTATSTTVKGRFASASDYTVSASKHVLAILLFDPASCTYESATDLKTSTTQVSTTSSALTNDAQVSITRSISGELLTFACANKQNNVVSSTNGLTYGINLDSVDVVKTHSCKSPNSAVVGESCMVAYATTVQSGSHTINGRYAANVNGDTAIVNNRILGALWLQTEAPPEVTTLAMSSTVAGSGSLTVTPSLIGIQPCTSSISGTGASTANIYEFKRVTSSVSGTGLLTSNASLNKLITSSISGSGALTANLIRLEPIASTIAGTGLLTSQASLNEIIASALIGSGASTANIIEFIKISSTVSGSGNETASIILLSSSIDLTSSVIGAGAYTANIYELEQITSSISGSGAETATMNILKPVTSTVSGSGALTANIYELEQIASTLAGSGALTTLASLNKIITSSISGTGLETANPIELIYIVSNVAGSGSETADIILLSSSVGLSSIVVGSGLQTANIEELSFISSSVSGSGLETANAFLYKYLNSNVSGTGSQSANLIELLQIISNVVASGDSSVTITVGGSFVGIGGVHPTSLYPSSLYPRSLYPRFAGGVPYTGWVGFDYPLTGDIEVHIRTVDIEVPTRTIDQDAQNIKSVLTSDQNVRTSEIFTNLRTVTLYDINKERTGTININERTGEIYPQDIRTGDIDQ